MTVVTENPQERTGLLAWFHQMLLAFSPEPCHVICLCMPNVSLCGAFAEGEISDDPVVASDCPSCLKVRKTGCLFCGCPGGQDCHLCEEKP